MNLHNFIDKFCWSRDPEILRQIYRKYGNQGFSTACRAAAISRGEGKRMIGIYDDTIAIKQISSKSGYKRRNYE